MSDMDVCDFHDLTDVNRVLDVRDENQWRANQASMEAHRQK
jgi:hypothetical protein